jgi:hypothetical protein
MDRFWRVALGIAGIGAIGFFVFWSLYRQWLTLPIFSILTQAQTFQLLVYFLWLTFGALVLAVTAYVVTHRPAQRLGDYVPVQSPCLSLPDGSRFTDEQFEAYKQVWSSLQHLRKSGDALWSLASEENLREFVKALREAIDLVNQGAIFFQQQDYSQLKEVLRRFASYRMGKERLIDLRSRPSYHVFLLEDIRDQIERNRSDLAEYSRLLEGIRENYNDRLSWRRAG